MNTAGSSHPKTAPGSSEYLQAQSQALIAQALKQNPDFAPHIQHVLEQQGVLGEGGMGRVLRVKDKRLGREAALKILQPNQGDMNAILRFKREAQIMARLDHPGIPPVYESGMTPEGQPFLLMKVVEGATLTERITQYHAGGCPENARDELLRALIKVSEAVAYAHSRGVIHRDLKPDNIMIGQFGEVLVMDWGLAKLIKEKDDPRLTRPSLVLSAVEAQNLGATDEGALLGTPGYMSPEQVSGEGVTELADVFALGALLFAMLTNEKVVKGDSAMAILTRTIKGEFQDLGDLKPETPPALVDLSREALKESTVDRLESAKDFGVQLQSFLERRQPRVAPAWLGWFMALALAALTTVLAGLLRQQGQDLRARDQELASLQAQSAEPRPAPTRRGLSRAQCQSAYRRSDPQSLLLFLQGRPLEDWLTARSFLKEQKDEAALLKFYEALSQAHSLDEARQLEWCALLRHEAESLRTGGDLEASLKGLRRCQFMQPTLEHRRLVAENLYELGDWPAALSAFGDCEELEQSSDDKSTGRLLKSFCLERMGRLVDALYALQEALGKPAGNKLYELHRARLLKKTRPKDAARFQRMLKDLLEDLPKSADLLTEVAFIELDAGRAESAQSYVMRAWEYRSSLQYFTEPELYGLQARIGLFIELKGLAPGPRRSMISERLREFNQGWRYPEATARGVKHDMAQDLLKLGEARAASKILLKLCEAEPLNTERLMTACEAAARCQKYVDAISVIEKARWAGNRSPWLLRLHGVFLSKAGKTKRALNRLEDFGKLNILDDCFVDFYRARGAAYFESRRYQRALQDFMKARAVREEPGVQAEIAGCAIELGRVKMAEEAIQQALKAEPENPDWLFLKARTKLLDGQRDEANALLKLARELQANSRRRQQYQRQFDAFAKALGKPRSNR